MAMPWLNHRILGNSMNGHDPGTIYDDRADSGNNRIQRLCANTGYFYSKFGTFGSLPGQFDNPENVYYDRKYEQLLVVDTGNDRIQIFQWGMGSDASVLPDVPPLIGEISDQQFNSPVACVSGNHDTEHIVYGIDAGTGDSVVKIKLPTYEPGGSPLHTFEGFKAALLDDDVEMALGFFTEIAALQYEPILEELRPDFEDIVNDMGGLILDEADGATRHYDLEKLNHGPIYLCPVHFNKNLDGHWKISFF